MLAVKTENINVGIETENDLTFSEVLTSTSRRSIIPTFGSSDAAILTQESVKPPMAPLAPMITLRPPPAVLLALASSNATSRDTASRDEAEDALESSTTELTEDDVKTSNDAISAATLSQEAEMSVTLASKTLTSWEVDVDDIADRPFSSIDDAYLEVQEATFDAGHQKDVNSSRSVDTSKPSIYRSLTDEPVDGRVRRSSGAVDA
jgi:hypothetical protein